MPPASFVYVLYRFPSRDGSGPSGGAAETAGPMFCFPLRWALLCFQGQRSLDLGHLDTFKSGWHATGFSGYWHIGSDHSSRCNGVILLTSSFALWVLCITNLVAPGRSNDPAFCYEKSGRCNLASLPFLCSFRNFSHGGAHASVIAIPVRIQS